MIRMYIFTRETDGIRIVNTIPRLAIYDIFHMIYIAGKGGFLLSENCRFSLLIVRICDIIYGIMEKFANE